MLPIIFGCEESEYDNNFSKIYNKGDGFEPGPPPPPPP